MAVHSNLENGSAEAVHASRKSDTKDATRGAVTSIPSRPTPSPAHGLSVAITDGARATLPGNRNSAQEICLGEGRIIEEPKTTSGRNWDRGIPYAPTPSTPRSRRLVYADRITFIGRAPHEKMSRDELVLAAKTTIRPANEPQRRETGRAVRYGAASPICRRSKK